MFQIKLQNKISPAGLDLFDKSKYTYHDEIENPDAIMVRSASLHEMAFGDNLKAIVRAGAGTNNIPVDRCTEQGIVVFNTPGANANAVKELALMGMLLASRHVLAATEWVKSLKGQGAEVPKLVEKGKGQFVGPEIKGKKLGVIGLGAIGALVANAALALGMEVYGYDPYLSVEGAWGLSADVHKAKSQKEIYEVCDYISIHVPLSPETKGMINATSISSMKNGAVILNFSRADLVVAEDIKEALAAKKVGCYVVDFPTDEVLDVEGILAIPHLGASTPESEDNCASMAAQQVIDFLENGNITNSVNLPDVSLPRGGDIRICVIHKNIPHMLSQISGFFSEKGINIENMINKAKKDYAYTMLDINGDRRCGFLGDLEQIEGIIKATAL